MTTTPMLPIHGSGPSMAPVVGGHIVSSSGNVMLALAMMQAYLNSTFDLQTADTQLEVKITDKETELVQQFQQSLTAPGDHIPGDHGTNYIYQLEHLVPGSSGYAQNVTIITNLYSAAQAKNQAEAKVMDGDNTTAQNVLSQNAQNQPGILQAMSALNGIEGNLSRILQG